MKRRIIVIVIKIIGYDSDWESMEQDGIRFDNENGHCLRRGWSLNSFDSKNYSFVIKILKNKQGKKTITRISVTRWVVSKCIFGSSEFDSPFCGRSESLLQIRSRKRCVMIFDEIEEFSKNREFLHFLRNEYNLDHVRTFANISLGWDNFLININIYLSNTFNWTNICACCMCIIFIVSK